MNWRAINFDWNHARAFLVTAEEGSLSAAARALGTTQPTLGRQVAALEAELGVALFERVGRGLMLTPSGIELMEHVKAMAEAANHFSLTASGQSDAIEGSVCISATEVTAAFVLPPMLRKLQVQQPGIRVEIVASNTVSDLKRREADIAIRAFRPTQPDLIARKLGDLHAALYATPDYIAHLGCPQTPADCGAARFIGFGNNQEYMAELNRQGFALTPAHFALQCDSHLVHWALTQQGLGIGVMPVEIGDAEPAVQRLFPNQAIFKGEVWLVSHRELRMNRRVRTVFDFLAAELA